MIRLFSLIALLVLSVSVSSAFVESAYAEEHEPIRIILDITYQNILDSIEIAELDEEDALDLVDSVNGQYDDAISLINLAAEGDSADIVAAKESVLEAMASFEVIAAGIESLENQASTQLPTGLGAGFDSASDEGIAKGQGLGVGGIPPGILKQIQAANMFGVHQEIVDLENEADGLRELIKLNNLDGVNFEDFEESVNLSKTLLAEGVVPDAQIKLILANKIIDDLYVKIGELVNEDSVNEIKERLGSIFHASTGNAAAAREAWEREDELLAWAEQQLATAQRTHPHDPEVARKLRRVRNTRAASLARTERLERSR